MTSLLTAVATSRSNPVRYWLLLFLWSGLPIPVLQAELRLPKIFGNHMVLQRDKPIHIWGWETADAKISVTWAGQTRTTTSDAEGRWSVHFDPVKASSIGRQLVVTSDSGSITLTDILVGEVWLCGGQSNMEWTLRTTRDADLEIGCADFPAIRFIRLPKIARLKPQEDFPVQSPENPVGNWRFATTQQVENCTAVGYYFARRVHR
ncbi:MAG: hypothetical protein VX438_08515, partial [Planctomycetota bacterium]|nr:hypothetical protein [Planctomycetota bacterium]